MQFFEELPRTRYTRATPIDWDKAKADLMENPGKWGLIAKNISGSTPGQIRAGRYKAFQGEELNHFEFTTSKPEDPEEPYADRRTDLYGRYSA